MAAMRWAAFALVLLSISAPAEDPARKLTVSQLEELLKKAHAHHQQDHKTAVEISGIELSERLSETALIRLQAMVEGHSQSAEALQLIADQSLFLKPAASELTDTSIPNGKARLQMLSGTVNYVNSVLTSLPNLLATRTTTSYSDAPNGSRGSYLVARATLRLVGKSSVEISMRNDGKGEEQKDKRSKAGMNSWGEFGSLLATVLMDTRHGKLSWGYWQPSPKGQLAVFYFEVQQAASHYLFRDLDGASQPGYHGSLWIDPASGVIDRIFLELDADKNAPYLSFHTMVQYGSITIDDKTFTCPVRSVAVEEFREAAPPVGYSQSHDPASDRWINETTFTNYHRFASTFKIITSPDASENKAPE